MNAPVPAPTPHSAIQGYVNELNTPHVVSTSHITLAYLYKIFGQENIYRWLDEYWSALREYHQKLKEDKTL